MSGAYNEIRKKLGTRCQEKILKKASVLIICGLLFLISGCASDRNFTYTYPDKKIFLTCSRGGITLSTTDTNFKEGTPTMVDLMNLCETLY